MSEELRPCAHCGAPGKIKRGKTVMVSCTECSASTFQLLDDKDSAIAAWNRRSAPIAEGEREAFEAWIKTRLGYPFAGTFTNLMWDAWQARAALASRPAAREAARQSIDTKAFRIVLDNWAGALHSCDHRTRTVYAKQAYNALIAHINTWGGAALAANTATQKENNA